MANGTKHLRKTVFRLDRTRGEPLHEQLYRQLRTAIATGEYRSGDALPRIRDLAAASGVGFKTARRVLLRLAADGLTTMRKYVGSVVVASRFPLTTERRILFFTPNPYFCFYNNQLVSEIRTRLVRDGGGVMTSMASACFGPNEFLQLSERLKEQWDLIVEIGHHPLSRNAIVASGRPFLVIGNGWVTATSDAPSCVGCVDIRNRLGVIDFVHDCIRKGVKSVLQVIETPRPFDASEPLGVAEIRTETIQLGEHAMPEDMAMASLAVMRKRLAIGRGALPDVILFTDDYIASGGLCALSGRRLRIPGDVAVVAHANKGHGPIWLKPLTRLEMDPAEHGTVIAEAISGYLAGRAFPRNLVLGSVYRRGETF